jgi:hypothetical protein
MQRSWLWFFGTVLVLAAAAIIIPIVYNLRLQLTPEQLGHARALWRERGTPNYDLDYSERRDRDPEPDEIWVKVRGGKVVAMAINGERVRFDDVSGLVLGPVTRNLPYRDLSPYTVDGLLDQIEARLKQDESSPGRRNYATASFDSRDGHPVRYVHRNMTTKKRLEWQIKLTRVEPGQ